MLPLFDTEKNALIYFLYFPVIFLTYFIQKKLINALIILMIKKIANLSSDILSLDSL